MIPPERCYGCPRVVFGLIPFLFQESLQLHIIETPQVRCFPAGQTGYHTNLLTALGCMFRPIRSESLTLKIHPNWWGQASLSFGTPHPSLSPAPLF